MGRLATATLSTIQKELKAPKSQYNSFGKYNYRNCEDILEALKPICNKYNSAVTLSDDVVMIGDRFYVKATATLIVYGENDEIDTVFTQAYAREEAEKKGMDGSQVTGASSSYARKYALNGLFGIDDTKDSDTTNAGEAQKGSFTPQNAKAKQTPTQMKKPENKPAMTYEQALQKKVFVKDAEGQPVCITLKEAYKKARGQIADLLNSGNEDVIEAIKLIEAEILKNKK